MRLGELSVRVLAAVRRDEPCVVMGGGLGGEGRKRLAGAALLGADGMPRAGARGTWIAIAAA
jgi:hypothetical protein